MTVFVDKKSQKLMKKKFNSAEKMKPAAILDTWLEKFTFLTSPSNL